MTSLSKPVQHNGKQEGQPRTFLICPKTPKHGTAIVTASDWIDRPSKETHLSLDRDTNQDLQREAHSLLRPSNLGCIYQYQGNSVGEKNKAVRRKQQSRQQFVHSSLFNWESPAWIHSCSGKTVMCEASTAQPSPLALPIGSESPSGE